MKISTKTVFLLLLPLLAISCGNEESSTLSSIHTHTLPFQITPKMNLGIIILVVAKAIFALTSRPTPIRKTAKGSKPAPLADT